MAATQMLKGEVYLWSGRQMGGGTADYTTAKTALQSIVSNANVSLQDDFSKVFAYNNKDNSEIIFSIRNAKDEYNMWDDRFRQNLVPQQAYMTSTYCNKEECHLKICPKDN